MNGRSFELISDFKWSHAGRSYQIRVEQGVFREAHYFITLIRRVNRRKRDFAMSQSVSRQVLQADRVHIRAGFLGPVLYELAADFEANLERSFDPK